MVLHHFTISPAGHARRERQRRDSQRPARGAVQHGARRRTGDVAHGSGGGLDESPHAYRRLPSGLAAQQGTIEVLHRLRPRVVGMAGAEEFDPYKD
jgi:hypothetical protein